MAVTTTQETAADTRAVYSLEGTLLEACSCGVLCPCWIGQDPDLGTCDAVNAYHFDRGERAAGAVEADMTPFRAADGTITTLRDSLFSTVPGSPALVGRASTFRVRLPQHGFEWSFEGRNAIQAEYRMEFRG